MDKRVFYSTNIEEMQFVPVAELRSEYSSKSPYLFQDSWKWIQILQRDESSIVSTMVLEDEVTLTSARIRFRELKSHLLSLSAMVDAQREMNEIFTVEGNLDFDQWILVVFGAIASSRKVSFVDHELMSMRNTLVNRWMEELPFIGNYLSNEKSVHIKSIERKHVILLDDYSDLDGVVEMILHYHVLRRSLLPLNDLCIIASNLLQLQLNAKWEVALDALIYGELNAQNTDYRHEVGGLNFVEQLPQGAIVLDWTKGQSSLPEFNYKDLLNWINA